MKKIKQILAICIVILLVGLYIATLIFAVIGSENTLGMFKAALYSTFILPVLLWAYGLVYRLLKNHGDEMAAKTFQNSSQDEPQEGAEDASQETFQEASSEE
ncbi:MAG: hypothetical protein ACI4DO_01670 [Roseburia sp.]